MNLFIDSNIFISAFFSANGAPARALKLAADSGIRMMTSQYNLREMWNVFERKFPSKVLNFQLFIQRHLQLGLEVVSLPAESLAVEEKIRDVKDRPIMRAAIAAGADWFLTGDKDFLEAEIFKPQILTASEFLEQF